MKKDRKTRATLIAFSALEMTNKEEERRSLLSSTDSTKSLGYGTESYSDHRKKELNSSISTLFIGCSSTIDKTVFVAGALLAVLSACFEPVNIVITCVPYGAALPYMEADRGGRLFRNWTEQDESLLLNMSDNFVRSAKTALLLVILTTVFQFVLIVFYMYLFGSVAVRVTSRLRYKYLNHILGMDMKWSQTTSAGELTAMLDENINKICDVLENNLPQAIFIATQLLTAVLAVLIIRWDIGLMMLCFIIPGIALFYFGTKFRINMVSKEQHWLSKAAEIATECFMCIKTVICFNGQQQTINRYNKMVANAMTVSRKRTMRVVFIDACRILLIDTLIGVAVFYGGYFINETEPFRLLAIYHIADQVSLSIPMLNIHFNAVVQAIASAKIITHIMAVEPEIELPSGETLESFAPKIGIKNVMFAYPSRPDMVVINNVSLDVSPGEKIAIVGESGSGKSTMAALLMRFFDCNYGSISIDGHDIKSLNVNWLRRQFGLVMQEPALFDMSIRENLLCSKPDASDKELTNAMLRANVLEFIVKMPKGLETRVGERGTQLSGGQKQRLAIARALLRDPSILIFDEATSSLDSKSENLVQSAIDRASVGRTTVTIAHRLSTILNSHRIIVMKEGKIVDQGTPNELMNKEGIFKQMLKQQNVATENEKTFAQSDSSVYSSDIEAKCQKRKLRKRNNTQSSLHIEDNIPFHSQQEEKPQNMSTSTLGAIKELIGLHPKCKTIMAVIVLASMFRSSRSPVFIVLLAMQFTALSYASQDIMLERMTKVLYSFMGVIVIGLLGEIALYFPASKYADELSTEVRSSLLRHFLSQNLPYFGTKSHSSGNLSAGLATLPANIRETFAATFPEFMTSVCLTSLATLLAFVVNPILAITTLALAAFASVLRFAEWQVLLKQENKFQPIQREAIAVASEALSNLETVKAYNVQAHFICAYRERHEAIEQNKMKRVLVNSLLVATGVCTDGIARAIAWLVGACLIVNWQYGTVFDILLCTFTVGMAHRRMQLILSQSQMISRAVASCSAVTEILAESIEVDTLSNTGITPEIDGKIRLEEVDFCYPSRSDVKVFERLSMEIGVSNTVAVVGASGSGKSTVLQLILRLFDCDAGHIKIDETNVKSLRLSHLHTNVVPVNQEPVLFNGTIYDNITNGMDQRQITMDQVFTAAENANIHQFIMSLPQGYDTSVGAMGAKLSGGQKQRIAIARALIRQPRVLLLDEATAALDTANEALVQAALDKAANKCTCVVVAHRLATIRNCQLIIVMKGGTIVEKGTHDGLMEKGGLYHSMCLRQMRIDD